LLKAKLSWVIAVIVLGVAALLLTKVWTKPEPAPQAVFKGIDGSTATTDSLKGQIVFVNFWATSCTTCVAEMPQIAQTHEKFKKRGYNTIAVAMSYDRADYVLNFAKTRNLPFTVALDVDGQVAKAFGDVKITPTSFLIDSQGNIIKRWVGAPDFEDLHAFLNKSLKS
jgi:peroxiredoxin